MSRREEDGRVSFRLSTLRPLGTSEEECPMGYFPFGLKHPMVGSHLIYDEPANGLSQGDGGLLLSTS